MLIAHFHEAVRARRLPIVADSETGLSLAREFDFDAIRIDAFDFQDPTRAALMLITTYEGHERLRALWQTTRATVAHMASAKFDSHPDTVRYALAHWLSLSMGDVLETRSAFYETLLSHRTVAASRTAAPEQVRCRFADSVMSANRDIEMRAGHLYSVAEFLEASIVNLKDRPPSFTLDGDFGFDGLIYLCNKPALKATEASYLDGLMRRARIGSNRLEIRDNYLTRVVIGGNDETREMQHRYGNRELGLHAMEFAAGCARYALPLDWTRNTAANEAVHGVHIGIGMGLAMPHIDFIAAGATPHGIDCATDGSARAQNGRPK